MQIFKNHKAAKAAQAETEIAKIAAKLVARGATPADARACAEEVHAAR